LKDLDVDRRKILILTIRTYGRTMREYWTAERLLVHGNNAMDLRTWT